MYIASESCGYFSSSCTGDDSGMVLKIVGITFGSVAVFVIIVSVIIYQCKRQAISGQRIISPRPYPNMNAQGFPMAHVNRNAPQAARIHAPYASSMPASWKEETLPSYDAAVLTLKDQE